MKRKLTHLDERGATRMVDVSAKPVQARRATAMAVLHCRPATIRLLRQAALPKGDALAVAKVAAIQAVKRTADLIPLCHPLPVDHVNLEFTIRPKHIAIRCTVTTAARTGVEMEALTGATVAALTLYDMCKAVDGTMVIDSIQVLEKIKA
ncbi:MAG: cyclic pyranopterin monophosphate synthase MoaC [Verrucomicrobia bacterium]|nr:cyclic pyranopterin monophosphate synthase MoaC [Verrucomicrobiota bacterium]